MVKAIPALCSALRYTCNVRGELWWDDEDAAHIRDRSTRYPGATSSRIGRWRRLPTGTGWSVIQIR